MHLIFRALVLTMGSFCLSIPAMAQAIEHTIYTYHSDPPFYLPDQPSDLSRAWVDRFNLSQEQIKLRLLHIERAALNQLIEQGKPYLMMVIPVMCWAVHSRLWCYNK
ncbi:hypothetical protein GCM10009092_38760 [Bowmanella denitrificans]|uniref:Uncharacterized protein n=1 Tax=Bowmanella denitrificans TaxID=366582 RepID=A0ABN0XR21_9ALTE